MTTKSLKLDAHQHFWRYSATEYPWMSEHQGAIKRDFSPADLVALQKPLGFDGSVAVQARQSETETTYLLSLARGDDRIKAVVGWVDLCARNVADRLAEFADDAALRGIRHVIHDEPDVDFALRNDFNYGISQLAQFDLTYDLLLFPKHLRNAKSLVQAFEDQPFVLDHMAKPFIKDAVIEPWAADIRELARCENVYCKLSGLVTEADWSAWQPADLRPYLDVVFDAFGHERLMIGSDWPVCTLAGEYSTVMGVVLDYVQTLEPGAREQVLGGNCARFYGLV